MALSCPVAAGELTSDAMPGRKLLLMSMLPSRSWPSSTLLLPFTMSTRYLNLKLRPRSLIPHQLGLTVYATSWSLAASSSIGPVPIGVALAPVTWSAADIPDQITLLTIGLCQRKFCHCVYAALEK